MKSVTIKTELREMLPAFAFWVLLPLPLATFWQVGPGRHFALLYLFTGAALVTAERISVQLNRPIDKLSKEVASTVWRTKLQSLLIAGAAAVCIFTFFGCSVDGTFDASIALYAALAILPAIACIPHLTLWSGGTYSAIVILFMLLAIIKLSGCVVVRAIYGPYALEQGYMTLPWTQPNFLVWFCLTGALGLSLTLFWLGRNLFVERLEQR